MKLAQPKSVVIASSLLASTLLVGALSACQQRSSEQQTTVNNDTAATSRTGENLPQTPPRDTYTGALGRAQSGAAHPDQPASVSMQGKNFLTTAAYDGALEVQAAQMAAERATSLEVRQFAKTMVENHSRVNDALTQLAQAKGVALPSEPNDEGRELLGKLSSLSGTEFDRTYAEEMRKAHERAVSTFEETAKSSTDEDIKSFAQTQLPTLRDHLRLAQTLPGAPSG